MPASLERPIETAAADETDMVEAPFSDESASPEIIDPVARANAGVVPRTSAELELEVIENSVAGTGRYVQDNIDEAGRDRNLSGINLEGLLESVHTDEERALQRASRTRLRQLSEDEARQGEVVYDRALRTGSVDDYKKAARLLIGATATSKVLSTHDELHPVNPVHYLKIADALTKQAEDRASQYEKVPGAEGELITRKEYLGQQAVRYFDQAISALMQDERVAEGSETTSDPEEVIAHAIAKAARKVDNTYENKVLTPQGEDQLAQDLMHGGAAAVRRIVETPTRGLEIIAPATEIITEEITGIHHYDLAA
jgi:hypothetical protein